ncbi:MAG: hypothetical protein JNM93_13445 [Bacteriovoracaceae bacterium]|nr:hypothetical protein [Bacteriovoracaceae bacterium]
MSKIFCALFLLITYFATRDVLAITDNELNELRYTKALVAYNNKNYAQAAKLIYQNLGTKEPHRESLELLAKIHEEKGSLLKAQKVYYFLIKKYFGEEILKVDSNKPAAIQRIPKADTMVMNYIYKVSDLFMQLQIKYQEKILKAEFGTEKKLLESRRNTVLALAYKYLLYLKQHGYEPTLVEYQLGLIAREKNEHELATRHFEQALEEEEKQKTPDEDLKDTMKFFIGDNLLKEGHRDLATKYFKSIYSTTKNDAVKNYSRLYIDSLTSDFWSFNAGTSLGNDANPFNLDPRNITLQAFNQPSNYFELHTNAFYNSKQDNDFMYTLNFNFNQTKFSDEIFRVADSRIFSVFSEMKFYNLPHSVRRLQMGFVLSQNHQLNIEDWRPYSNTFSLAPYYDVYSKKGIFTFGLPMRRVSYQKIRNGSAVTQEFLASFGYSPWTRARFFSPSMTVSFGTTETSNSTIISQSNNLRASFSNQTQLTDELNLYFNLTHYQDEADNTQDTYKIDSVGFSLLRDLKKIIPGSVLELGWSSSFMERDLDPGKTITKTVFFGTLDFFF